MARRWRWALAAALAATVFGSVAPASAAGTTSLSLSSGTAVVRIGSSTLLSGTAETSGRRLSGAAIELWTRPVGSPSWSHVANTTSNPLGHYTFRYTPEQARVLQVRLPGGRASSPIATVGVRLAVDAFYAIGCPGGNNGSGYVVMIGRAPRLATGTLVTSQYRFQVPIGSPPNPWVSPDPRDQDARDEVAPDGTFRVQAVTSTIPVEVRVVMNGRVNVTGAFGPVWGGAAPLTEPGQDCTRFFPVDSN